MSEKEPITMKYVMENPGKKGVWTKSMVTETDIVAGNLQLKTESDL